MKKPADEFSRIMNEMNDEFGKIVNLVKNYASDLLKSAQKLELLANDFKKLDMGQK